MDHLRYKTYRFDSEKNLKLLQMPDRQIGFQEVIDEITSGNALDIKKHFNQIKYPHQYIISVQIKGKVYSVPCVEEGEDGFFLKTIYPSSRARDKFFPENKNNKS